VPHSAGTHVRHADEDKLRSYSSRVKLSINRTLNTGGESLCRQIGDRAIRFLISLEHLENSN